MPKDPFINEETGMLYVAGSHAGGNRVAIRDVSFVLPAAGMPCYGAVEEPFRLTLALSTPQTLNVAPPARDGAERLDSEG